LDDGKIENEEFFLYKLAEMIKIPDAFVTSIESTDAFITKHKVKFLILIIRTLSNIL
jgi:uncharacterized membrane protein YebE (DUF533 family)